MGFKSRNQVMMEQVYQDRGMIGEMTEVAYSLLEDYKDIDVAKAAFLDMFESDQSTAEDVWEDVISGAV